MKKILLLLLFSSLTFASGYKISYHSVNAVSKAAANVAYTDGADAAYYNPSNIVWESNQSIFETNLNYIQIGKINYIGALGTDKSNVEKELIPTLFYVSKPFDDFRYSIALFSGYGLSQKWDGVGAVGAKEVTLKTMELNPSIAYKVNENTSFSAGIRIIKSEVTNKTTVFDIEGDGLNSGYNLALSFRPNDTSSFAITYRSKIDMKMDGIDKTYGNVKASLLAPASLNVAYAQKFNEDMILEINFDKIYWSDYKQIVLDFDSIPDVTIQKNWRDTDAYGLSLTKYYKKYTIMTGIAYEEYAIPASTLNFEIADQNTMTYSLGTKYKYNDTLSIGVAGLYYDKLGSRESTLVNGTFDGGNIYMVSFGLEYRY